VQPSLVQPVLSLLSGRSLTTIPVKHLDAGPVSRPRPRVPPTLLQLRKSSGITGMTSPVEEAKALAGARAVDNHVTKETRVLGIGSGSTIVYAVKRLAQRVTEEGLKIRCIPTSFQARQLIQSYNLPLTDLETEPRIDLTIDGCDEADLSLSLIKGGGGCQTQEKIVASASDQFVVIADYRKASEALGEAWDYVPLEVLPMAYRPIIDRVTSTLGGHCKIRMAKAKAGPVVTDNGGMLLDWYWDKTTQLDWATVDAKLQAIPGLIETGLFVGMAHTAYFGMEDGSVSTRDRNA